MFSSIDMSGFPPEREQSLKNIYRYHAFETILYRSNLWMHAHRVLWLTESILPLAEKYLEIDSEKARVLALVHDDAEILTGDHPAGKKSLMTQQEHEMLKLQEKEAIETLSGRFPKTIHGYVYQQLLLEALEKNSVEAQLVSYADKIDGYCESLHELLAGNMTILRSVLFYENFFSQSQKRFPALALLLQSKESPLIYLINHSSPIENKRYVHLNKPHTKESIRIGTDFSFYNMWRTLVTERGGEEGLQWLAEQHECLPQP